MLHHMLRAAAQRAFSVLDPYFQYVTMLLHGDGTNGAQNNTFLDSSTNNFTITRNGNTTQGTFTPYGSNWSYNSGTSSTDYLTTASNAAFAFGTGDFTMEAFVFATASQTDNWIIGLASNCWFRVGSGGALEFYNSVASTSTLASSALPLNTWTHVAVVRSGTALTIYQNGVSVGSATVSTNFSTSVACTIGNQVGFDRRWNGYISNARVVKGTAVYTAAFTPSTTPLTAITNTSLLTCQSNRFIDNSTNAFTLTVSGSPSVQRFSPFSPTSAYSTSVIGGSGYFDGSGDYLDVPSSATFGYGTGNFTIEFWAYFTTISGSTPNLIDQRSGTSTQVVPTLYLNAGVFSYYVNGNNRFTGPTLVANQWYHIAICRSSGTTTFYVNGISVGTYADSNNYIASPVRIFADNGSGGAPTTQAGYCSNLRIVNGTAVYTSNFTPPTAPLTAITNTSLLLNYTNAGILDNAMMNDLETVGNAQISTSVKKYGTGSMAFDGTGDYLVGPSSQNFAFGTGDFTVECWVYINSNQSYATLIDTTGNAGSTGSVGWILEYSATRGFSFYFANGSSFLSYSTTPATSTWTHLAITRSGSTARLFINGTSVASGTYTNNITNNASISIGAAGGNQFPFNGYIDDLRITKGYARYTANFTPPTAAFPNN